MNDTTIPFEMLHDLLCEKQASVEKRLKLCKEQIEVRRQEIEALERAEKILQQKFDEKIS